MPHHAVGIYSTVLEVFEFEHGADENRQAGEYGYIGDRADIDERAACQSIGTKEVDPVDIVEAEEAEVHVRAQRIFRAGFGPERNFHLHVDLVETETLIEDDAASRVLLHTVLQFNLREEELLEIHTETEAEITGREQYPEVVKLAGILGPEFQVPRMRCTSVLIIDRSLDELRIPVRVTQAVCHVNEILLVVLFRN